MNTLWTDIRFSLRMLAKNPAFAFTAILVLALGIGATTAIFSIVNAVLIRPLPYHDPARLVAISSVFEKAGAAHKFPYVSLNEVEYWRENCHSLESIGSFVFSSLPIHVGSESLIVVAIGADPELVATLGVRPVMGANLPGSGSRRKDPFIVISHRLWVDAFHSDPAVIGRSLDMDGSVAVVAGVLPSGFQFPRSDASFQREDPDIIYPVANIADTWGRNSTQWIAIGRLKPGIPMAVANADLKSLTTRMAASDASLSGMSVDLAALDHETTSSVRPALALALGISIVLLLIACTNIMNLLFSRAAQRANEMTIRAALGATSGRLARQMLTEGACLTFMAGAIGVAVASMTLDSLVALSPAHLPLSGPVAIDWRVLGFAFLICVVASVIAGILPALHRSRASESLISSGSRASASRGMLAFQRGLMVAQIALGVGLLAAAGLLTRSLYRLSSVDPGFRTENTLVFEVAFPSGRPEQATRLSQGILDATRRVPGVVSAGWITNPPPETRSGVFIPITIAGAPTTSQLISNFQVTSEDYFSSAGISLARGRDFSIADAANAPRVAVINETLARRYFPGIDPVGRHIAVMWEGTNQREIVGVIRDTHDRGLGAKPFPTIYVPYRQFALAYGGVVARTSVAPESLFQEIRRRVTQVDPMTALTHLSSVEARLYKTLDTPRFYTMIAGACALMAVLFVTLGLYGVISYGASQRTREIGIRVALGAERREILRGIVWQGLQMAAIGIIGGIAISLASTRLLRSLLFEIQPIDPATLSAAAALIVIVTLAASFIPARRASRVDPIVALRHD